MPASDDASGAPAADDPFPPGFFTRADPGSDTTFYAPPRLVTHIDDRAIAAVGELYEELDVSGDVLDLMGSWVSHFRSSPRHLTVLGMNAVELAANPQAAATTLHDLNVDPRLPFADRELDRVGVAGCGRTFLEVVGHSRPSLPRIA